MDFRVCDRIFLILLGLIDREMKFFHHHLAYFFHSDKLDEVSNDFSKIVFRIVEEIELFLVKFDKIEVSERFSWVDFYLHNDGIDEADKCTFKHLNLLQFVHLRPKLVNLFDELPPKPRLIPPFHSLIM